MSVSNDLAPILVYDKILEAIDLLWLSELFSENSYSWKKFKTATKLDW